jgi:hypothetical protein
MIRRTLTLLCLSAAMLAAQAQTIDSVQVEPSRAAVGQAVKLTTQFVVKDTINCKVRVHFGDGEFTDFIVNQTKDVPMVLAHAYKQAGKYNMRVEGRGMTRCMGEAKNVEVNVVPKGVAVAAAPLAVASTPVCPLGWTLTKAGIHKKTGAFTCVAKPQSGVPEPRLSCPGDLTYFENIKKGQLGCRI